LVGFGRVPSVWKKIFCFGRRQRTEWRRPLSLRWLPLARIIESATPTDSLAHSIAYCQTDPPEIKEDFEREERIMQATGMNDPDYKYDGKYRVLSPH
jgi:hypothetical protein